MGVIKEKIKQIQFFRPDGYQDKFIYEGPVRQINFEIAKIEQLTLRPEVPVEGSVFNDRTILWSQDVVYPDFARLTSRYDFRNRLAYFSNWDAFKNEPLDEYRIQALDPVTGLCLGYILALSANTRNQRISMRLVEKIKPLPDWDMASRKRQLFTGTMEELIQVAKKGK
jgi:hypothetical protein